MNRFQHKTEHLTDLHRTEDKKSSVAFAPGEDKISVEKIITDVHEIFAEARLKQFALRHTGSELS